MPTPASHYLTQTDSALKRSAHYPEEVEKAQQAIAVAQVSAIQAVAAAIDRLAQAVEALDPKRFR